MVKYKIDGAKFIIQDYQKAKRFSSFLPAIAGEDGKPTWVFYANVGQAVGGFGIHSKEYPMTPFDSAFMAYQNIPLKSFRTFIQVDDREIIEPFSMTNESTLIVEKSKITIQNSNDLFDIEIVYSTISHQRYPGLIRKVTIKNKDGNHSYKIVDGLPVFLPKGANNYSYHELTTLVAAYCSVDLNDNAPFVVYTNRGGDDSKVVTKQDGNAFITIDKNNRRLSSLVDNNILFRYDDSLINPLGFDDCFKENLDQALSNEIPCAFSISQTSLAPNEEYSFVSLFSSFDSKNDFNDVTRNLSYDFLNNQIQITERLIDSLIPATKTSNNVLNEYLKQCFLDNGLRGGFPLQKDGKTLYLYSRKHGDMERDYNSFNIPSTYFSSGLGNYRDINQNRRNDLYLNPYIKDKNIYLFMSLIEANGFNPLLVDASILKKDYSTYEDALKAVEQVDNLSVSADYIEGYWTDHFAYNLDLIENYISIYPDKIPDLLFNKKYRYYDSHIHIKPRKERYVLTETKEVRQYNSLEKINGLSSCWLLDSNNKVIQADLASKLFVLIALKFSSFDPDQMGLEMLANKPGWNDSCNGLPGIFGSSMNETIELLRLVKFYLKVVSPFKKDVEVIRPLISLVDVMRKNKPDGINYWNVVNEEREKYEESYRNSDLVVIDATRINDVLLYFQEVLDKAIKHSISINNGVIPTYFYRKVTNFHFDNGVVVDSFETKILPNFLEAPARLLKLGKSYVSDEQIKAIDSSDLLDKELHIYKTSLSLKNESNELGRTTSFTQGWLERESCFLHMTFKYLLGLLKAGYYKEFFEGAKNNMPCFMNPSIYGRSPFENVSFIVPTNHPNKDIHGQGFYARLTGANTEIINIVYLLAFGDNLFDYIDEELTLSIKPHIPLSLFKDGVVTIEIFNGVIVRFVNKNGKDYDEQNNISYSINNVNYERVPEDVALKIRDSKIKEVTVFIN